MILAFLHEEPQRPGRTEGPLPEARQPGADQPGARQPGWLDEVLSALKEAEPEEDRSLYCFVCGTMVTHMDSRISVQGAHHHTCTNPGGYVYEIGCFGDAQGCGQAGEPTEQFSWFSGYAWSYAFCSDCRTHLGWVFESAAETPALFFGLILNRLTSGRDSFPSTS